MEKNEIINSLKTFLRWTLSILSKLVSAKFILFIMFLLELVLCECSNRSYEVKNVKLGLVVNQYFKNAEGLTLPIEETIFELLDESGCIQTSKAGCDEC